MRIVTEDHTVKGPRSIEASDSEIEKEKREVKHIPVEFFDEKPDASSTEEVKAEKGPILETLAPLQPIVTVKDMPDIRSTSGDQKHLEELEDLAAAAYRRFMGTGNVRDINKAIESWETAFVFASSLQTDACGLLGNIGCAYESRFGRLGELSDLNKAIESKTQAVSLTPDGHPDKPGYLNDLGNSYETRFVRLGELSDLDKAIESQIQAVLLTPDGHTNKPACLTNLGSSYHTRFQRLSELFDLDKAIECQAQAVSLTPDGHPEKPACLNNLGSSYRSQFERLGELSGLNEAIKLHAQAISLTPDGDLGKPGRLNNLGNAYEARFGRLGELSDLNRAVESQTQAVSLTPDSHPGKPGFLNNLGVSYHTRFERLGELRDLNKAIECQAQAVSLTPDDHLDKPICFDNLGNTYRARFTRLGELSDLNKAIESGEQAVSLTAGDHPNKPVCLHNLGVSYRNRFGRLGELSDLNKAIESGARAVSLAPDGHPNRPILLNGIGISYITRFGRMDGLSDLNKAIKFQTQAVSLTPDGHPDKPGYLNDLGNSYETRFRRLGELSDLSRAIESQTQAVSLIPDGHPGKPEYFNNLGNSYETRFGRLDKLSDLNKAIDLQVQAVELTPDGHTGKPACLYNLGISYGTRFGRLGELSDLNNAIRYTAQAASLTANGHPNKPACLSSLGLSYRTRFLRLGELSDLNEAIESQVQAVSLIPNGHSDKPGFLNNLGVLYENRFERLGELSDAQSAISSFRSAAQSATGPPSVRFLACRHWASLSSFDHSSSSLSAYTQAMQLLPQLIWVGTTLDRRYELIAEAGDLAAEAASHAISFAAFDLALEWLEAGRSIVWAQITQLRTPFDQLAAHDPELANQLRQVGHKLEQAGSRSSPLPEEHNDNGELVDEANSHVELALSWDNLLAKARSIAGFEDFLRSAKSSQLLNKPRSGPVVVINIHRSRCDALIIQTNLNAVSHVPLTTFCHEMVISAREYLVSLVGPRGFKKVGGKPGSHKFGLLEQSLRNLWLGVVQPVLAYLGFLDKSPDDTLPHITWCTTGPLSFLPLHAAGCYDQSSSSTFDHVVSSYTPTLSALLLNQSRPPCTPYGIVAVGLEHIPSFSSLPYINDELKIIERHAHASGYLQLKGGEATVHQVLDAMNQFSWVHMACHGTQNTTDPTQSAFHLHDGPLTLARITKQSLTNKGLAFLSACQTATGDEKMPDEAVHLAAGMLMAGYPSVIGTMWSIADEDGPVIANRVYVELLKDGKMDHTKAAWALHQAVGELRAKVGAKNIERWAPFVHIGS